MSGDKIVEVTRTSWISRLGGAIKGVIFGAILVAAGCVLLFWNEGRAVTSYQSLKEGQGAVVRASADKLDSANEGKLIHVSGKAVTADTLSDPTFGVSAPNALRLVRTVQMYQWVEEKDTKTKKELGGAETKETTYAYEKKWSGDPIDSTEFKTPAGHENPAMPWRSDKWQAATVTLGAYALPDDLVGRIGNFTPWAAGTAVPALLAGKAQALPNGYYVGANAGAPQIGDCKIVWRVVLPAEVSVIARQTGGSLSAYPTKAGNPIQMLSMGMVQPETMFTAAISRNKTVTWLLRLAGFVILLMAFNMIFRPLAVLADVIPALGTIVGEATGLVAAVLAFGLTLVVIALGWLAARPLLGIVLLAIAAVAVVGLVVKLKGAKKPVARERR